MSSVTSELVVMSSGFWFLQAAKQTNFSLPTCRVHDKHKMLFGKLLFMKRFGVQSDWPPSLPSVSPGPISASANVNLAVS